MPRNFISPTGQAATEDEACVNGVVRDGYRLGFDLMFMDSNGPGRMYLRDASANDAEIQTIVARERMVHDTRFAFLGDKAPPFDEDRAGFLARTRLATEHGAAVRDAARVANTVMTDLRAEVATARRAKIADLNGTPTTGRDMRDLARASQYR